MVKRRTPVEHNVSSYTRDDGTRIKTHRRGSGTRVQKQRRVVGAIEKNWDKDFGEFSRKYDARLEEVFEDDPKFESIIESIGHVDPRGGGEDTFEDHEAELLFYIRDGLTPPDIEQAAIKLYNSYSKPSDRWRG